MPVSTSAAKIDHVDQVLHLLANRLAGLGEPVGQLFGRQIAVQPATILSSSCDQVGSCWSTWASRSHNWSVHCSVSTRSVVGQHAAQPAVIDHRQAGDVLVDQEGDGRAQRRLRRDGQHRITHQLLGGRPALADAGRGR